MELNEQFVQDIRRPIRMSWNAIAEDMEGQEISNAEALEMAIDADRLETFSSKEDNQLLRTAINEHGYSKVFKFLKQHINLV